MCPLFLSFHYANADGTSNNYSVCFNPIMISYQLAILLLQCQIVSHVNNNIMTLIACVVS